MTDLRWSRRTTTIAEELVQLGIAVSPHTVARLLRDMGYSLRVNQKQISASSSPNRNLQFDYLAELRYRFQRRHLPIVSVDSKNANSPAISKILAAVGNLPRVVFTITSSAPIPSASPFLMGFTMLWKIAVLWWSAFPMTLPPLPLMPSRIGGTRSIKTSLAFPYVAVHESGSGP